MKISCFLTSFNRPSLVRRALESVASQAWSDYELFVLDESDLFDVKDAVKEFEFRCPSSINVHTWKRTPAERAAKNPMSWKLNQALGDATGDVIVYLCDDDYYYQGWFEAVALHFMADDWANMAFGVLVHEKYGTIQQIPLVRDPLRVLDHCQVAHRRLDPPVKWPEEMDKETATAPDGYYFREVRRRFGEEDEAFYQLPTNAVMKGHHPKTWLKTWGKGPVEGLREG